MTGRRITYLALLAVAVVLHLAYGQYISHYMVLFLLCVPVISVLLSIPAAVSSEVRLTGGEDVCRGRESKVGLSFKSGAFFSPEAWSITIESRNAYTGRVTSRQRIRESGIKTDEMSFTPDTSQLGCVRFKIKRAFILDYLGLIPIPVKKSKSVTITVLPNEETPTPEPDLVADSARALRGKPQGFSEEHEMRPYRDGDPLNLIHWKLSRKYDGYIVREPQEVVRKDIIMVIDLPRFYEDHRSVLEQHRYLNSKLLESEIPYTLQFGKTTYRISSLNDYNDFITGVLAEPMKFEKASMPDRSKDALIYRVIPGKGVSV